MSTSIYSIENPVFIVASGRSGSTHLRLMLDHHPQLACLEEIDFTVQLMSDDGDFPKLDQYYQWLETNRIFLNRELTIDRNLDYLQLVNSFLCQKRDRDRKSLVSAVVHHNFDRLLKLWPDARFIHLVRDGRDVAYSCVSEMGWYGNFWQGVEYWERSEKLWTKLQEVVPVERRTEITYESLMSQTVETLTQVCDFIGISYDPAMLSYPETTTYSLPDPKFIGQWKQKMSDYDIRLVEARIGNLLLSRGYKLSGLPPLTIKSAKERYLKLQDWWVRLQFRINRYGLALFLSDYLSRHLKDKAWQKSIKFQFNAIDAASLK